MDAAFDTARRRLMIFDLDGTLVDTLDDLTASANRLLARSGFQPLHPDQVRPMVGDGVPALVSRVLAHAGLAVDEATAIADFTADYTRNAAGTSRLFPGVAESLAQLRDDGWDLAVCTNKPEAAARALLGALGVAPLLAAIGGGDSFATRKPDPGHLLGTIRAAGGNRRRSILVGDHANDVAAGRAALVPCIFALWGYGPPSMAHGSAAMARDIAEVAALGAAMLCG